MSVRLIAGFAELRSAARPHWSHTCPALSQPRTLAWPCIQRTAGQEEHPICCCHNLTFDRLHLTDRRPSTPSHVSSIASSMSQAKHAFPGAAAAMLWYGRCLLRAGQREVGLAALREAVAFGPAAGADGAWAHASAASMLRAMRRSDCAQREAEEASGCGIHSYTSTSWCADCVGLAWRQQGVRLAAVRWHLRFCSFLSPRCSSHSAEICARPFAPEASLAMRASHGHSCEQNDRTNRRPTAAASSPRPRHTTAPPLSTLPPTTSAAARCCLPVGRRAIAAPTRWTMPSLTATQRCDYFPSTSALSSGRRRAYSRRARGDPSIAHRFHANVYVKHESDRVRWLAGDGDSSRLLLPSAPPRWPH